MQSGLKLFSYWRSSSAYRVRIALNLKGLDYELIPIHLVRDGGQQHHPEFRKLNPQGLVPVLTDGGRVFRQSTAICEYLDESYPTRPLLPADIRSRARVRALTHLIGCDVQPLNNLRVLMYLEKELNVTGDRKTHWYRYWVEEGFTAFEELLSESLSTGEFCEGDDPTMADAFLVPQVYNALRYEIDLKPYPELQRVYKNCLSMDEFQRAAPEAQPDAS